ncbi:MAG TPA: DNA-binding response regulator, partial [Halieaceae bacterium]|nr:DNA-binding response regulator [Halieaceae bacterium]
ADGRQALEHFAQAEPPDLTLMDIMLPYHDGLELIERLRAQPGWDSVPVLMLTAKAREVDIVRALELGADDYVTKPFQPEEVEARVRALLRRVEGRRSSVADYGTLRIDFSARRVCRGDEELTLTAYEYNTLAYLAHRAGEVISRSELLDHLYDHDHDRDGNVIEQFVARLRRKLDPEGSLTPIETVRGAGYRFTLDRASA